MICIVLYLLFSTTLGKSKFTFLNPNFSERHKHVTQFAAFHQCDHERGKKIKVGHIRGSFFNYYIKGGNKIYYGEFKRFFEYLESALDWKFEFIESFDGHIAGQFPNGTYSGFLGMLTRNEVDTAFGIVATFPRSKSIDFSFPYEFDHMALLSHKPGYKSKHLALTWPFTTQTWIATFLSYLFFSILFLFIIKLANYLTLNKEPQEYYYNMLNCWHETCKPYFGTGIIFG